MRKAEMLWYPQCCTEFVTGIECFLIFSVFAGLVGLAIGLAAGRYLLIRGNRGEALVASLLFRLSCP